VSEEVRDFGILQLWDAVAAAVPERECIVQGERRLSWGEVAERTARLGWWLTGHGFGPRPEPTADWESPNDLVGLLMRNCPEYLEGSLGAYRARCAPFNINYRYKADELAHLFADAKPVALIYQLEFAPELEAAIARGGVERPALIHVEDGSGNEPPAGSVPYEEALRTATEPAEPVVPTPDDVHVLYTGGTTGMPKGVIWNLRNLAGRPCGISIDSLEQAASDAPRRGWLRALPAPPLMHGTAAWFSYGAWARGGTLVLSEDRSFDAARTLELCRRETITWMAIVGDAFAKPLLEALDAGEPAPEKIAYIFSSGAVLSNSAWRGLEGYFPGLKLVNALGSSETGPQALQTSTGQSHFSPGPGTCVVSEDHSMVLDAEHPGVGWLSNAGELPRGYLNDAERTERTFKVVGSRRLAISGDKAEVDASGAITFLGRESNVINSAGEKIYADEVEGVLAALPQVADALVFGRPSERWGQEVVALLVARGDERLDRDALRAACDEHLAGYKIPKAVEWVPAIRRFDNGKPDYKWAKELVGA
jgi:fatty-acyl-CoA synthase